MIKKSIMDAFFKKGMMIEKKKTGKKTTQLLRTVKAHKKIQERTKEYYKCKKKLSLIMKQQVQAKLNNAISEITKKYEEPVKAAGGKLCIHMPVYLHSVQPRKRCPTEKEISSSQRRVALAAGWTQLTKTPSQKKKMFPTSQKWPTSRKKT